MDKDWFPLKVGEYIFDCFYQRGNLVGDHWEKSDTGDAHIAVCKCGKGAFGDSIDDAVEKLKKSYSIVRPTEHFHFQGALECSAILSIPESGTMGTISPPELLVDLPDEKTQESLKDSTGDPHIAEPTYAELKATLAELEATLAEMQAEQRGGGITFKVSDTGGVTVYGLPLSPVTLYYEQWMRLLDKAQELREFLEQNKGKLK